MIQQDAVSPESTFLALLAAETLPQQTFTSLNEVMKWEMFIKQ